MKNEKTNGENKFEKGDVVQLQSGSVPMTFGSHSSPHPGMYGCAWENPISKEICKGEFYMDALKLVRRKEAAK